VGRVAGVGGHGNWCGGRGRYHRGVSDRARAVGDGESGGGADGVSHTIVGELSRLGAESGQSSDDLGHVRSLCSGDGCTSGVVLDETESTSC